MKINKIKVENIINNKGRAIPNQFIITTPQGEYLQSYKSIIIFKDNYGTIYIDTDYYKYSKTTGKYRCYYLNEDTKTTDYKLKNGIYHKAKLN